MEFPLTRENINSFLVTADAFDNDNKKLRNMSDDEKIEKIYEYAVEQEAYFSCHAFYYDDDTDIGVAMITLNWDTEEGFSANLRIEYDEDCTPDSDVYYDIPLDTVPMKMYGTKELPEFEVVINKGIELFNANFDESRYCK